LNAEKNNLNNEREDNNDTTYLQQGGRNNDTRGTVTEERNDRQIRTNESELLKEQQKQPVSIDDAKGNTIGTFSRDRQGSKITSRDDSKSNGEVRRNNGRNEVNRSDEVDRTYEQYPPFGGRNGTIGTGIQLNILDNIIDDKAEQRETDSAFSSPENKIEIPAKNFIITDDNLGFGGAKEKYRYNIEAIKVLKQCETEERTATPEEQITLSKYVGWGGIQEAFDEHNESWNKEYHELKNILTTGEYDSARASTLNAHYTSPIIIKAMYKALFNMGFNSGNILEPSCGIGNFMGLKPTYMRDTKFYGIEIDSISGRIAKLLYPENNIQIQGYESTNFSDNFFDVAIGNVPFGSYRLPDKKYDKYSFLIHDYFFAKTIDKVCPGGIIAFITSSGTLDKKNNSVRKYISQRADLIGAIRLPNNAFTKNAGAIVTTDIIFLQKRNSMTDIAPEWVDLGITDNGLPINSYFIEHPEMVLGEIEEVSTQYGKNVVCKPFKDADLSEQLDIAVSNLNAVIPEYTHDDETEETYNTIPADPNVRNFSFTAVDTDIYYRENSIMRKVEVNDTSRDRIREMIALRDCVKELIQLQSEDESDEIIREKQLELNTLYNSFSKEYGLINSKSNEKAFSDDSSYFLLCSLEILDENNNFLRKADMFSKRTIKPSRAITKAETSSEAYAISIGEKAKVDINFMSELTGKTEDELYNELQNVIYLNPLYTEGSTSQEKYLSADEYLSGNVREKLQIAKMKAETDKRYTVNVEALTTVQPQDLTASEISLKLGTYWIPEEYIEKFTHDLLGTPFYLKGKITVKYYDQTSEWNISGKSVDKGNIRARATYGTSRVNAYKIIEDTLNGRDVRVYDYVEDENGKAKQVLNQKETAVAQQKQEQIKQEFLDWIWKEPTRRETLVKIYNEKFNSTRPRSYDGNHIIFHGMNPEIELRQHQKDGIARVIYGGNSLLGHVVGAGKTWTMASAAMEMKYLGLCSKSMFVVPNHLTEQWASEFLYLYPSANLLIAKKKDFEAKNRKKFCAKIATGDYDAIIIGHSQFEKIPMSAEWQQNILESQLNDIMDSINEIKASNGERYTIKQLEKTKRSLETKLEKLNDTSRKDDVITFEELGVDRVFVDEAHLFKNLYLYTKMRNIAGIPQTEAQKSQDLFMKSRYLDDVTGGKGLILATGTPISNSMTELYTMQRYLQYGELQKRGLQNFDAWASTFGETVTSIELAPEGTGYRAKTRFAKFHNLPELMNMFREVADIVTSDMIKLPVPNVTYHNVAVEATRIQKEYVSECGNRAEKVRNGSVTPDVDNMLKITNDGRKIALDSRLINPLYPDESTSKVNTCVDNVYNIWTDTKDNKCTQLLFCDLSTPKTDGTFSVYNDIKDKLISKGIPEDEIKFIHEADTEIKKKELFSKVRNGNVRVLIGSTAKMGAGTNVQKLLIASHDLDCPWRPSDLEQRAGRIIRQGNTNKDVHIYRYVTKDTFDSYMWQTVENKQKFISQILTSKSPVRSADDIDEMVLSYAETKALATGNPHIKERMELDTEVSKLKMLKSSFLNQKYALEDMVSKTYPKMIAEIKENIYSISEDIETISNYPKTEGVFYPMTIGNIRYDSKEEAGTVLLENCKSISFDKEIELGNYRGFSMSVYIDKLYNTVNLNLKNSLKYTVELGTDIYGNITRIDNVLDSLSDKKEALLLRLSETEKQLNNAKEECTKEFPKEEDLREKVKRLSVLDSLLNMDVRENIVIDEKSEIEIEDDTVSEKQVKERKFEICI